MVLARLCLRVANVFFLTGCSINDLIAQCASEARNHGQFVSCVADVTNELKRDGVISGKEQGAIQSCAGDAPEEEEKKEKKKKKK